MKNNLFLFLFLLFIACGDDNKNKNNESVSRPQLKGKLAYHNYTNYDANDSKLWLYDFGTNTLENISKDWDIINPMNAHFSPDGKLIVFMGITPGGTWDIFLYTIGSSEKPINLTPTGQTRDEDPKFSPDGKRIAYKQNHCVCEMDLGTRKITILSPQGYSMPYYNWDGTKLVCSKGDAANSSIEEIDIASKSIRTLYDTPGVQDYYPINADEKSFYYSTGLSENNRIDQVVRGYWDGLIGKSLPFNNTDGDYSDAYPVNDQWVIISSTRKGTLGGYDLYIANVESGDVYSMNEYNKDINTPKNELGAAVFIEK